MRFWEVYTKDEGYRESSGEIEGSRRIQNLAKKDFVGMLMHTDLVGAQLQKREDRWTAATSQEQVVCRECGRTFRGPQETYKRDISVYRREASQLRNRVVLSNAQHARDGLGVLVALLSTENVREKVRTHSFNINKKLILLLSSILLVPLLRSVTSSPCACVP